MPARLTPDIVARIAAALTALVAVVVLAGWFYDNPLLTGFGGVITMKANMAVGLVACALSLALPNKPRWFVIVPAVTLAAFAGLIGGLTLFEHLSRRDVGLDQLLFSEPAGAAATTSPGRMGINGALSLVLAATALIHLRGTTAAAITRAQLLACALLLLALVPIIGYIYDAPALYSNPRVTGIAFPTALTFLVLSIGIVAARLREGRMSVLMSGGPAGVMARRLLFPAFTIPIALGFILVVGQRAGLYEFEVGTAIFAMSLAGIFTVLIWRTATIVEDADAGRREALAAVQQSEARFRRLANVVPQFVWVHDAEGHLQFVNDQWVEYSGLSLEETADPARLTAVTHPDDRERLWAQWTTSHESGAPLEVNARLRSAAGAYRWFLIRSEPTRDRPGGRITGWYGTSTDITAQQEMLAAERSSREAAEKANRLKDDFLATLSHELRTPLTAIVGWADMLRRQSVPPHRVRHGIDVIFNNAVRQRALIEDLLDMSRIASGQMRLHVVNVPVADAVRAAVDMVQPTAAQKQIEVTVAPDLPPVACRADRGRLQQILGNLLSNAVKFTPAGGRVTIDAAVTDGFVELSVRDSGIGIAPEFLPHVFDAFKQADSAPTREYSGLGLGLAIVHSLVMLHEGRIEAHSDGPGRGSTFTVALPVAHAAAAT